MSGTSAPEPAEWLSLAAAPTFAAMALATAAAAGGPTDALCGSESGWPLDGMVVMYLLMSAFHVAPWLKRMGGRRATDDQSIEEGSGCSPRQTL
jgi:hypothetical protein